MSGRRISVLHRLTLPTGDSDLVLEQCGRPPVASSDAFRLFSVRLPGTMNSQRGPLGLMCSEELGHEAAVEAIYVSDCGRSLLG